MAMKNEAFVFENNAGETVRFVNWQSSELYIIQRDDTHRIEFIEDTTPLEKEEIPFTLITEVSKKQVINKPYEIRNYGRLKHVAHDLVLQNDVRPTEEKEDKMPIIFKYTALAYVGVVVLFMGTAWIKDKFFSESTEPTLVQVMIQDRQEKSKSLKKIIEVKEKKVNRKANVSNKTVIAKSKVQNKSVALSGKGTSRHGTNTKNIGALGALGGFSESSNGRGGLKIQAKADNAGVGFGGSAALGGHERSLVGQGLVQSGLGGSKSNLKGYGGYGTEGLGGGKPGYGNMKMAGSSGAYFSPLADESLIEGGLDRDQINAVIQRNLGQVIYCYEQELQANPKLSGRVAVKFVINGVGQVNTANVAHTSLNSSRVESCIVDKLRAWKFPKPSGSVNVRVTYPFVLKRLSS
jgi:outer membrane biosynthesis protein TonB